MMKKEIVNQPYLKTYNKRGLLKKYRGIDESLNLELDEIDELQESLNKI